MMIGRFFVVCVLFVLVSSDGRTTYSIYQTTEKIVADGFPSETHHVTTSDGYILEMHRIPHGRSGGTTTEDKQVVFLMHGLLSASNAFIALGAEYSLAYNLADAGFDVWMGNARGNKNSRYHVSLNPNDEQEKFSFFDFSFEEIGIYDLPAMIDFVLAHTGKDKLHYIGHSQGGTVFLVMASMLPEYNQKLSSAHLLAGVGYQEYFPNEELIQSAAMVDQIYGLALYNGVVELFPPNSTEMVPDGLFPWPSRTSDYCAGNLQMKHMCQLIGVRHIVREFSPTDQAGAALKQMAHYGQNIRDKVFRRFHHGTDVNLGIYGTTEPPVYDLSRITTFVTMHYTLNDALLDERDVLAMAADMPRTIARQVARTSFLHEDFVAAFDAKELVTNYIIGALNNEGQEDYYTGSSNAANGSPNATTVSLNATTVSPNTTTVSPSPTSVSTSPTTVSPNPTPGSATMIVINAYLIVLSLYLMLK